MEDNSHFYLFDPSTRLFMYDDNLSNETLQKSKVRFPKVTGRYNLSEHIFNPDLFLYTIKDIAKEKRIDIVIDKDFGRRSTENYSIINAGCYF